MSGSRAVPCDAASKISKMAEQWRHASHALTQMPALGRAFRTKCAIMHCAEIASDAARSTYFALTRAVHLVGENTSARAAVFASGLRGIFRGPRISRASLGAPLAFAANMLDISKIRMVFRAPRTTGARVQS